MESITHLLVSVPIELIINLGGWVKKGDSGIMAVRCWSAGYVYSGQLKALEENSSTLPTGLP